MAVVITRAVAEVYDPNVTDNSGGLNVLGLAIGGDIEAGRLFAPRPLTFMCEFTTTGSETVAAASSVMNLSTLGVPFPANTMRNIRMRMWSRRAAAADSGYVERVFCVKGAATLATITVAGQITGAFSVGLATEPDTLVAFMNTATDFGIPFAASDATGVFIVGYTADTTAIQTSLTVNVRNRIEVLVEPLVAIPVF